MTHYGTIRGVYDNLPGLENSISEATVNRALTSADNFINRNVTGLSFSATPEELVQIAEDYATGRALMMIQHSSDEVSESAKLWLQDAKDGLEDFINNNLINAKSPRYASSHTPGDSYMEEDDFDDEAEDLRSVQEGTNWE